MRKISYVMVAAILTLSACSSDAFKKGDEGLEYKIVSEGSGQKVKYGEFLQIHVGQFYNTGKMDSVLTNTRTTAPLIEVLDSVSTPPQYFKILNQLRKGDSLVIRILSDSAFKKMPQNMPPFIKKGHYLVTTVKVLNIFTSREQADSARNAEMAVAQKRDSIDNIATLKEDDKKLNDYFAKNNIKAVKAPQGTYVQIITPGTGNNADTSVVAKTNYTGRTLEGKTFDSNTDPAFNHVEPYNVNMTNDPSLGSRSIKGMTDGMTLLNKGAKAKFYIPSSLGYGKQGAGADIGPNAILVFDIEVLDLLDKAKAAADLKAVNQKMQDLQKHMMDSIQNSRAKAKADTSKK